MAMLEPGSVPHGRDCGYFGAGLGAEDAAGAISQLEKPGPADFSFLRGQLLIIT
jgi:hypothetical protein